MTITENAFLNTRHVAAGDETIERHPLVLLVEDDRALRRYLQIVLERANYRVISAANGLEGMKVALTMDVDVIITDAMMPHLNGYELCRFVRNSPQLSHLPIVLLSARERKDGAREIEQADVFLSKPVSAEALTSCLEQLLRTKQ